MNLQVIRSLLLLLLFTCVGCLTTYAQKETAIWYFGSGAGVDFNSGSPAALTDGQVQSQVGASSICDPQGNLLFYTDGNQVWNRNHGQMPNGYGLRGATFPTHQPTVIVPNPANEKIFYVFSVNFNTPSPNVISFTYAVVDLSLQGGLGDVTAKKILLLNSIYNVLTAVRHFNGKDVWVIVHGLENNNFYAFLVTGAGVTTTPVVSSIGSICTGSFGKQMKASPDGSKIAHTLNDPTEYFTEQEKLEVFRFNNATGKLTDLIFSINSDKDKYPYYARNLAGIEFSPNNALLYATDLDNSGSDYIFQFDLNAGSGEAIIKSMTRIGLPIYGLQENMQLALDGKIYIVHGGGEDWGTLSRIEFPNIKGPNCKYVEQAVPLAGKLAIIGLPLFIQSYFTNPPKIESTGGCVADSVFFQAYSMGSIDSVRWNFGEPLSGKANTYSDLNPKHKFASTGSYQVTLTTYLGGMARQLSKTITIHPVPMVSLGPDTAVCAGVPYELSGGSWAKYRWSTGDTTAAIAVTTSGTYWLEASNGYCTSRDTIKIQVLPVLKVNLGADIATCTLPPLTLDAGNVGLRYNWSTGSTLQKIEITQSGDYWVKVSNDKCYEVDTIRVNFLTSNDLAAYVKDDTLSYSEPAQFTATGSNVISWAWDFGDGTTSFSQHPEHLYQQEGLYEVTLLTENANHCSARKTLHVYQEPYLFIPNVFTPNADGKNDQFVILYNGREPYHLVIVNRWGKEMFTSNDRSNYWNGTNGENGVYFYRLQTGKTSYKGWVHLLR